MNFKLLIIIFILINEYQSYNETSFNCEDRNRFDKELDNFILLINGLKIYLIKKNNILISNLELFKRRYEIVLDIGEQSMITNNLNYEFLNDKLIGSIKSNDKNILVFKQDGFIEYKQFLFISGIPQFSDYDSTYDWLIGNNYFDHDEIVNFFIYYQNNKDTIKFNYSIENGKQQVLMSKLWSVENNFRGRPIDYLIKQSIIFKFDEENLLFELDRDLNIHIRNENYNLITSLRLNKLFGCQDQLIETTTATTTTTATFNITRPIPKNNDHNEEPIRNKKIILISILIVVIILIIHLVLVMFTFKRRTN